LCFVWPLVRVSESREQSREQRQVAGVGAGAREQIRASEGLQQGKLGSMQFGT
jgi:hypothetical protein